MRFRVGVLVDNVGIASEMGISLLVLINDCDSTIVRASKARVNFFLVAVVGADIDDRPAHIRDIITLEGLLFPVPVQGEYITSHNHNHFRMC